MSATATDETITHEAGALREELYTLIDTASAAIGRLVLAGVPAGDPRLGGLRACSSEIGAQIGEINGLLIAVDEGSIDPAIARIRIDRIREGNAGFRSRVALLARG